MSRSLLYVMTALKVLLVLTATSKAQGQDLPYSELALSAEFTSSQLEVFAAREHQTRIAVLSSTLVSAALMVPTGVVLLRKSDPVPHQIGIGLTVGGAAPLLFAWGSRKPGALEQLSTRFEERRARGEDLALVVHDTELAWEEAARRAALTRKRSGTVHLVLGGVAAIAGAVFLLCPSGSLGVSHDKQYTIGSALMGPGLPLLGGGLRELLIPSLEETSWDAYSAARATASRVVSAPRVALDVTPKGAGMNLAVAF